MLTEVKCHDSHFQLFNGHKCVATVRAEYKDVVKAAIETSLVPLANRDYTEEK